MFPLDVVKGKYTSFEPFFEANKTHRYTANSGIIWYNTITRYRLTMISFIENAVLYDFSVIFWGEVFKIDFVRKEKDGGYANYQDTIYLDENFLEWCFVNSDIFPTTQGNCRKASEILSSNIPQVKEIAGKYLPVLDYSDVIAPTWSKLLNFKTNLEIADFLTILEKMWKGGLRSEEQQKEEQQRVTLIYERISAKVLHQSEKEILRDWGKLNKLLAKNGKDFYYPSELSIVAVDGFRAENLAFVGKSNEENLALLELFGVRIINKVEPIISNSMVEIADLRAKLSEISPLIALVAVEKSRDHKDWETEFHRINQKLYDIHFYETDEILLDYGNAEDRQKRSSWAMENNFYYVGKWYLPRVLDGLVESIGDFFKIRYAQRILNVLLLESFSGGKEYLLEKGYDISLISKELSDPIELGAQMINQNNRSYNQSDEDLGKQGEKFVFGELKRFYQHKYQARIEGTESGFRIGDKVEVFWRNMLLLTSQDHDFKVVEKSKDTYIDSKATAYDKNIQKLPLYISGNELNRMENCERYLIARVYNATSEQPSMELVRLSLDKLGV